MIRKITFIFLIFMFVMSNLQAQHNTSDKYILPDDSLVINNLKKWQGLKFGLFMHWGPYSQWGVVESWSLCPEDEDWCKREGLYASNYYDYVKAYENLQTTFNPLKFNPVKWADAAKEAGMRYVVFTTKHHDGFCMFDTKQTDYKITSSKTPFSSQPGSNVTNEIFKAFRDRGFLTGAYFSKPDWNSDLYWWRYFPPKNRNSTYDPKKYPERWNRFKDFTYRQIEELMTQYGRVDILWLDGGWVRPYSTIDSSIVWQKGIPFNQDIDMKRIASMARKNQPGILIIDRTISGEFENYVTPEQTVPEKPMEIPWESCITMGNSWSYVPGDKYKTASQLINLLINVVSKGGNLLLNIGPSGEGDWDEIAYQRLKEISSWMKKNSGAIYDSEPLYPYSSGNMVYTTSSDKKRHYIYILPVEGKEIVELPETIAIDQLSLKKGSIVELMNGSGIKLKWKENGNGFTLSVPETIRKRLHLKYAAVIKVSEP